MGEKNETPWPSFGHLGMWYAEYSNRAMQQLSVPVTLIQRWWRQRSLPRSRRRLYPICFEEGAKRRACAESMSHVVERIAYNRKSSNLLREVAAYEKLDGTNLGVRCDGAIFGRRNRIRGDAYQHVKLAGSAPTAEQVAAIKHAISEHALSDDPRGTESVPPLPRLVLYGELMCNPFKFNYDKRFEDCKFFSFGAIFDPATSEEDSVRVPFEDMMNLCRRLNDFGLNAEIAPESGRVRMVMNDRLGTLVESVGVRCAPLLDKGPLREVCFGMRETLLADGVEGVVLTGRGCLMKWKTSSEDESRGHSVLSDLLAKCSEETLKLAGADAAFARLLVEVAPSGTRTNREERKTKREGAKPRGPYEISDLESALRSAASKYDALDAYFGRGERDVIRNDLREEVTRDLGARREDEVKCVEGFVNKFVGVAFGKWKRFGVDNRPV